ncbi:hypothetical protein CBM2626_A40012 [Cupriavidus taiwanensis]|nr:hypothetical protein CBM2626_A40012 [Cupriavidus taiwanensis]
MEAFYCCKCLKKNPIPATRL